jgi:hypothetical protein
MTKALKTKPAVSPSPLDPVGSAIAPFIYFDAASTFGFKSPFHNG